MNAIITEAIKRGLDSDCSLVPVGKHEIDEQVTLRITGTLTKAPDTTFVPQTSVPLKQTLAIVMERLGLAKEEASELVLGAMLEAIECADRLSPEVQQRITQIEAAEAVAKSAVGKLPSKPRAGAVTCKVKVECLEEVRRSFVAQGAVF